MKESFINSDRTIVAHLSAHQQRRFHGLRAGAVADACQRFVYERRNEYNHWCAFQRISSVAATEHFRDNVGKCGGLDGTWESGACGVRFCCVCRAVCHGAVGDVECYARNRTGVYAVPSFCIHGSILSTAALPLRNSRVPGKFSALRESPDHHRYGPRHYCLR